MKRIAMMSAWCALALGAGTQAACPDHFSPRAKELLADAVTVQPTAHQLNVVYFLGNDNEPVADYERRLSELLLYLQQFYAKEMARNGFGNRAFGLDLKENGNVNIILLRGQHPSKDYSYSGEGAVRCLEELQKFYEANPGISHSQHNFIIMPTFYTEEYNDRTPGGVPFFGFGKNCFALDYVGFDIEHLGKDTYEGHLLTKWYGGFAHELGHGLNLPHNNGTVSENAQLGTALMNSGNYTFGFSPTYMTKASCAILDRSETFAPAGDQTVFYPNQQTLPTMEDLRLTYGPKALVITFQSTGNWRHLNAYVQEPPYVVNRDYDAVAFTADVSAPKKGVRKVKVEIPYAELDSLKNPEDRQLSFIFVGEDGNRYRWSYPLDVQSMRSGQGEVLLKAPLVRPSGY